MQDGHYIGVKVFLLLLLSCSSLTAAPMVQQPAARSNGAAGGSDDGKDLRTLEPGKPIKREITVEQEHAYRIQVRANQFLKVIIEQQGADVIAEVSEPPGEQVLQFESESRAYGIETVSLVSDAATDYRLVVSPKYVGVPNGGYEIRIEELRAATERDRALSEAFKQSQTSRRLMVAGKYDEALPLAARSSRLPAVAGSFGPFTFSMMVSARR